MAILIVELRHEVLAQRKRAKLQLRKRQEERGWVPILSAEENDDNKSDDEDDDDDAGVFNKLTDRKRRKAFESEIHQQIRSYNDMLASDLKGLPEVKLARMIPPTNPLRKNNTNAATTKKSPWFRPHFTQQLSMIFSRDDIDDENDSFRGHSEDDERSKSSLTIKKNPISTLFASPYKRRQLNATPKDVPKSIDGVPERPISGLTGPETSQLRLSSNQIDEAEALEDLGSGEELQLRASTSSNSDTNQRHSRLHALLDSLKGQPKALTATQEEDSESLFSDPGPNRRSWSRGQRAPTERIREIRQGVTEYVERKREDHVIHQKFIIPADDYETFAGAEEVGNKMLQLTSSIMSHGPPPHADSTIDSGRNMSEKELLEYINRCISSNQSHSLDFMAGFFRDNTVSQTMVNSKARIVWIHDWFPLKECTYGISVDKEKKRVIVLFRGAITRADWSHGFDAALKKGPNPIKEDYAKKTAYLKIHRGFYTYLFRKRKDTGTSKFDEIVNKTYEYGSKMIGEDFTVTTLGFSLGGALCILFGFYASADERLTKNAPVKVFSYGAPYSVSHSFADAFRHQEKMKKVQHARFYNSHDVVPHLPFNGKITPRGSMFVHVGIDVKLYPATTMISLFGTRYPRFRYNKEQSPVASYWRAITLNTFLNMPFPLPSRIRNTHSLTELQKRIARLMKILDSESLSNNTKHPYLNLTLDEAYQKMVHQSD